MRNKLIGSVLSVALLSAGSAFALDIDPKFYVGGELQATKFKPKKEVSKALEENDLKLKQSKAGAGVFVGSRLNENFGVEAGYSLLGKIKIVRKNGNEEANDALTAKNRNIHADILGYLPINENVDVIGSIGVGQLKTTFKNKDIQKALKDSGAKMQKTGLRLGLGAQYKFDENIGARFMVRHQKGNDLLKSVNSAGLGLFYQF